MQRRRSLKRTIIRYLANQGFEVTGFEAEQFGADVRIAALESGKDPGRVLAEVDVAARRDRAGLPTPGP